MFVIIFACPAGAGITLNFDIIRNKGLEGEYSKKDIMGYMMNVCDATVTETEGGWKLEHLDMAR